MNFKTGKDETQKRKKIWKIQGIGEYVEGGDDAGGVAGLEFNGGAEVAGSERAEGFEAAAGGAIEPNGKGVLGEALVLRAP